METMDEMVRVSYYQEIMPGEGMNADFTIEPEWIKERSDGIPPGDYMAGPLQGTFVLDVPTFDRWRKILCRAALGFEAESVWSSPSAFSDEPFYELIQCEKRNVFGPSTSFNLAEDFAKMEEEIEQKVSSQVKVKELQFFMDIYQLFKKAFAVSCNSGCTIFSN
jgi:hypothetical protein